MLSRSRTALALAASSRLRTSAKKPFKQFLVLVQFNCFRTHLETERPVVMVLESSLEDDDYQRSQGFVQGITTRYVCKLGALHAWGCGPRLDTRIGYWVTQT